MRPFKFQITLKLTFRQELENSKIKYSLLIFFNSKAQTVVNDLDIDDSSETSNQIILSKVQKWLSKDSGWIIESVDIDYIGIYIYSVLADVYKYNCLNK